MKTKLVFSAIAIIVVLAVTALCVERNTREINMWKHTPARNLSLAVEHQDTAKIVKIMKIHPELLNYQEPQNGFTLLIWAVGREKYQSAEALLQCGANPNISATHAGETALFVAAGTSWVHPDAHLDPKYVKLLLKYGADPNIVYAGVKPPGNHSDIIEPGTSPLFYSIQCHPLVCCMEKTRALVEGGADINAKTASGRTAAVEALIYGRINAPEDLMRYAHYLIAVKKAKITDPYHRPQIFSWVGDMKEKFYAVNILRDWIPALHSKGHQIKMEIVKEFARQGVDYSKTTISDERLEQIQKLYPNTWKEYVKQY